MALLLRKTTLTHLPKPSWRKPLREYSRKRESHVQIILCKESKQPSLIFRTSTLKATNICRVQKSVIHILWIIIGVLSSSRKKSIFPHLILFSPFLPLDLCVYNTDGGGGSTFTGFLLCAQNCGKSFAFHDINTHLMFVTAPQSQYYYFLPFPDEEARKDEDTCPRSHSHFVFVSSKTP